MAGRRCRSTITCPRAPGLISVGKARLKPWLATYATSPPGRADSALPLQVPLNKSSASGYGTGYNSLPDHEFGRSVVAAA